MGISATSELTGLLLLTMVAISQAASPEPIETTGDALFSGYYPKAADNISGATCFGNGKCLLVADERIGIQTIDLESVDGQPAFRPGTVLSALFDDWCRRNSHRDTCTNQEVDLEGIARRDASVIVAGSMGNKRKSGNRARLRWFLAQFSIDDDGIPIAATLRIQADQVILARLFRPHKRIEPFAEKPLQCGGLNIEGFAQIGDDLFFGLRSPANRNKGQAMIVRSPDNILSITAAKQVEPTQVYVLSFQGSDGKPIKNIGIRALERFGSRLLIATGDTRVSAPDSQKKADKLVKRCRDVISGDRLPNISGKKRMQPRIWIWNPESGEDPVELAALTGAYRNEKLEGMALLGDPDSSDGPIDLLLTIDDPGNVPALAILRGLTVPPPP